MRPEFPGDYHAVPKFSSAKDWFDFWGAKPYLYKNDFFIVLISLVFLYLGYYLIKILLKRYNNLLIFVLTVFKKNISSNPIEQAILTQNRLIKIVIFCLILPFVIKSCYVFIINVNKYAPKALDKISNFLNYIKASYRIAFETPYPDFIPIITLSFSLIVSIGICLIIKKYIISRYI